METPPAPTRQILNHLLTSRGPVHGDALSAVCPAEPDEQAAFACREVAPAAIEETHLLAAYALDVHTGADGVAIALLAIAYQFQPQPAVLGRRAIVQQRDRSAAVAE